jgi:tetratricopeptide (TPR) repeat protein
VGKPERFQRVEHLEAQGRLREAVDLLSEMVQSQPDARAYVGLGKDLGQLGDYQAAEQALRTALRLSPESAQAHYQLAKVLWARAEQRWRQGGDRAQAEGWFRTASDEARQALAHSPDHALAHMVLGLCDLRLGRRADGLASLGAAVRCSPDLVEPNLHLGEALAEDGRVDEARGYLEQAARLARPDDPRPRAALARLPGTKNKKK